MHCGIGDASGAEGEAEATGFKVQEEVILHTRRNVGHFGVVEVGKLHGNVSYIGGFQSLKACKLLWWYYRTRIKWLWADICCDSLLFIDDGVTEDKLTGPAALLLIMAQFGETPESLLLLAIEADVSRTPASYFECCCGFVIIVASIPERSRCVASKLITIK